MDQLTVNTHRLLQLMAMLRDSRQMGGLARLDALGLSYSHIRAMHALSPKRTMAMKELAESLALTPPSVTALTRRLVANGMVERTVDTADSRVTLLTLTEAGRDLLATIYHIQNERMKSMLRGLSAEEQEQFLMLMERAVNALYHADHHCTHEPSADHDVNTLEEPEEGA